MVAPLVIGAGISAGASLAKSLADYLGSRRAEKAEKKKYKSQLKEQKRKTFADLLNESLNRGHDLEKEGRRSQNDLAMARAQALQNLAASFRGR